MCNDEVVGVEVVCDEGGGDRMVEFEQWQVLTSVFVSISPAVPAMLNLNIFMAITGWWSLSNSQRKGRDC